MKKLSLELFFRKRELQKEQNKVNQKYVETKENDENDERDDVDQEAKCYTNNTRATPN